MIAPARLAAYDVLRAVGSGREDLARALARARTSLADERDRALAGEIATGTLRWQAAFDHIVASTTGRPIGKLDPEVLDILRLTIFQLLHLDRVPASAAVNDAVSLTKRAGKRSAAPFVNAVLRRVSRQRDRLPLPPRPAPGDEAGEREYLSVTLSHPLWLAERWRQRYGFAAAEAWATFDNTPAALTLRANRLKTTPERLTTALATHGVRVEPGRYAPDALVAREGNPLLTPLADQGEFFVQDEASQLVAVFAGARAGERILDACAAPGGKTTAMAADAGDRASIVATDLRGRRVDLLAKTVAASGTRSVRVVRADVSRQLPFRPIFDLVLLDAPCSGLGTIRRDPDIKWRRRAEDLPDLAKAQVQLMQQAAEVLRPGGRLVYSTCSSEPEENEDVVRTFLDTRSDFRRAEPSGKIPALARLLTGEGWMRTLPHRDGLEAFFAAALVKTLNPQ
jgi:16S rRNA (cytosine967-C5)-methyltransferase